jgi:prepilin-type N-terminal cleavage/methylation domain-containing protein
VNASRRQNDEGFTLIEALIVVAIIGVLATLAFVGYRKLIGESRAHEARAMILGIHTAQAKYYQENGVRYANVSASIDSLYPQTNPGPYKTAWGATCGNCSTQTWNDLPLNVSEPVMFGYATVAGLAGDNRPVVTVEGKTVTWPANVNPWYVVRAKGDTNGDGVACNLYSSSYDTRIYVEYEGE